MSHANLRIEADLERLADLREFVRTQARAGSAPIDCLDDLVQAVDEAATNVITHGYRGAHGWIDVDIALEDGRFVVTLEDDAPPFDPTSVAAPDLSIPPLARRPGGMGVHLIRMGVDEVSHRPRPGGGNILTMVRSVASESRKEG
jgi:serine/threonine-protein kinase RsbW